MTGKTPPIHQQAIRFVLDTANGRNALSKLIPPVLFLADAVFCALIIWKVPCKPAISAKLSPFFRPL